MLNRKRRRPKRKGLGSAACLPLRAGIAAAYRGADGRNTQYAILNARLEGLFLAYQTSGDQPAAVYYAHGNGDCEGRVAEYLAEGNNPDQPGRLLVWLYRRTPVYAWRVPGRWFDIGTPDTLAEAARLFEA